MVVPGGRGSSYEQGAPVATIPERWPHRPDYSCSRASRFDTVVTPYKGPGWRGGGYERGTHVCRCLCGNHFWEARTDADAWGANAFVRTPHPTPYALHPAPYTLHPTPYTLHPTPYTLHPTPFTLHPSPFHPSPFTLHPSPYTLHPTHYKPHTTPYTLHPRPYTLHPSL